MQREQIKIKENNETLNTNIAMLDEQTKIEKI